MKRETFFDYLACRNKTIEGVVIVARVKE
jgi:hypothetical protein